MRKSYAWSSGSSPDFSSANARTQYMNPRADLAGLHASEGRAR